ncbi:MAG TPA: putative glycolipid-binding domain-containing protein [Acidimicrobiales bacterium]|nr:putative glycolipid-binding domain-containing protein [Acidimicrobiales bacterium]
MLMTTSEEPGDKPVDEPRTTILLWRSATLATAERFTDGVIPGGRQLSGLVLAAVDGEPATITYRVVVDDAWRTRTADVEVERPGVLPLRIATRLDSAGRWTRNGEGVDELDGCVDIELGFTPATATLPIRRLGLAVGESHLVSAARLSFPGFELAPRDVTYTRLADDRWSCACASGDDDVELVVDAWGHVLRHGDDRWVAEARSSR